MELQWNQLTTQDRAEFATWLRERHDASDADARATDPTTRVPMRYSEMTFAQKQAFHDRIGLPMGYAAAAEARADEKRRAAQ